MNRPESLCDRCDKYASCLLNYDGPACRRNRTTQPTNGDRIRAMSDFELAEMLDLISGQVIGTEVDDWIAWVKKETDNG